MDCSLCFLSSEKGQVNFLWLLIGPVFQVQGLTGLAVCNECFESRQIVLILASEGMLIKRAWGGGCCLCLSVIDSPEKHSAGLIGGESTQSRSISW